MPSISCRYICKGKNTHTKLYIWENDDEIHNIAFNGSANYSMQAFHYRRECMSLCDPVAGLNYFNSLLDDTINCLDYTIQEREALRNTENLPEEYDDPDSKDYSYYTTKEPVPNGVLKVSLLTARGEVGYGSGINWGIRPNGTKRDRDQAYIPYNTRDRRPGFFPDRVNPEDDNCPLFRVVTKDAGTFHMRMAQAGNKALHTAESNAILGKWIRRRLGVSSGTFVTKQMLEDYGRTYVTFKNMLMEHIRLTFNFTDLVRNFWNGFPATALTLRCRRNCFSIPARFNKVFEERVILVHPFNGSVMLPRQIRRFPFCHLR